MLLESNIPDCWMVRGQDDNNTNSAYAELGKKALDRQKK